MLNITPVCQHPVVINSMATRPRLPIRNPLITPRHWDPASCSEKFLPYEQNNTESICCVLQRTYCRYYCITREHGNSIWRIINTFDILPNQNCSTINRVSVDNNKGILPIASVLHCDFLIAKRRHTSVIDRIRSRIIIEVKLLDKIIQKVYVVYYREPIVGITV